MSKVFEQGRQQIIEMWRRAVDRMPEDSDENFLTDLFCKMRGGKEFTLPTAEEYIRLATIADVPQSRPGANIPGWNGWSKPVRHELVNDGRAVSAELQRIASCFEHDVTAGELMSWGIRA
jgi:hypothetical protein